MPEPADLKPYESLNGAEAKINFITKYADEHPGSEAIMVYKVLDDNDVKVRMAAMGILAMKNLDDPNVVYVASKALKDSELKVRKSAIQALTTASFAANRAAKCWHENLFEFEYPISLSVKIFFRKLSPHFSIASLILNISTISTPVPKIIE